jgi:hypothetical protein
MEAKIYYHKGRQVEFDLLPLFLKEKIVSLQNNNSKKDGKQSRISTGNQPGIKKRKGIKEKQGI